jgi:hypothetical protein
LIVPSYAYGMAANLPALAENAPELRLSLFHWYVAHVEDLLPEQMRTIVAGAWCQSAKDVKEISAWVTGQGMECKEPQERPGQ